jgi:DNA-binding response OmpR family regulator
MVRPVRRVLLVIRDSRLRLGVAALLREAGIETVDCAGVAVLGAVAARTPGEVALLDWTVAEGLLAEEHRPGLRALGRLVPIVLLVPRRWCGLLDPADLGVVLLAKPFDAETLLAALRSAGGHAEPPPTSLLVSPAGRPS